MRTEIHHSIRTRRLALGLSQAEVARRSGIQQRQVSHFERGGDVTVSTLLKLAQALDLELTSVPREDAARVDWVLQVQHAPVPSSASPSLLDRYQVADDPAHSNG